MRHNSSEIAAAFASRNRLMVVGRPFVLEFAGAFLDDQAPEFDREVWEAWEDENREAFGDRWREVNAVLEVLEGHGIHMLDVNPGNIPFAD